MSDMRLVVVGAAGRMGQTLIRTIHTMDGVTRRRRHRARRLAASRQGCRRDRRASARSTCP